jgi:hypothetical protein
MPNVTDSLDLAMSSLQEIDAELLHGLDQLNYVDAAEFELLISAIRLIATARGRLVYLLERLGQERDLLVQLGQLVRSNKCSNCGRWFEVPSSSASRRRYCSPACRTAAWRVRSDASAMTAQITPD